MFAPRIVITGAGPGGLALSRLLHLRGIPSTILDLRPPPTPQELSLPSGMLDLHETTGLATIQACGLQTGFQAALGDCSEAVRIRNPAGKLLYSDEGQFATRPEIPRASLINLLYSSLPKDTVRWGTKVSKVHTEPTPSGAVEAVITLADGEEVRADFVVGADGAWSKTRRLLTSSHPAYTGIQYITATARFVSQKYPHLLDMCGTGSFFAMGDGHGIMTHRGPQDSLRVYMGVKTPIEHWAESVGAKGSPATKTAEIILGDSGLFRDWAPELKEIIKVACEEDSKDGINPSVDIKPIYQLPKTDKWEARTGVTVLGDAAHLMAPNGEGVNVALADALDLARLVGGQVDVQTAKEWQVAIEPKMREYEVVMRERAARSYADTEELMGVMHGENAAEAMVRMFEGFGMDEEGGEAQKAEVVEMTKG